MRIPVMKVTSSAPQPAFVGCVAGGYAGAGAFVGAIWQAEMSAMTAMLAEKRTGYIEDSFNGF
jgi:hypothetical protein